MGYFVGLPLGGAAEKDCQVRFGKNMTFQVETRAPHLPAECLSFSVACLSPHKGQLPCRISDEARGAAAERIAVSESIL